MSAGPFIASRWFKRSLISLAAVGILAVGLVLSIPAIGPPQVETQPAAVVAEAGDNLQRGIAASTTRYTALAEYYAASAPTE